MVTRYGNVVLVTGASSGIGKAIAEYLEGKGLRVYGTSRKASFNDEVALDSNGSGGFIKMIPLDVCNDESAKKAVNYVLQREGHIDILINNAGFGIAGSVEDTTAEEAYRQFNTNFFGVLRMCREVLPSMRSRGNGLIINISSVAGAIAIPFQSMYSASKYAIEAMTEAMRIEVKPFGIKVSMVEPGDTRTGFTEKRQFVAAAKNGSAYSSKFTKSVNTMIQSEINGPTPEKVVKAVARIISSTNPPVRITAGISYKLIIFLERLLPLRFINYVVGKLY